MNVRYCSVCSSSFDVDEEGCEGLIGLVPFAFCATCRVGIWEWAQISFDLVPNPEEQPAPRPAPYGYCPVCGAVGVSRERRPNGDDKCANGHTYPSLKAEPR